MLKHPYPQFNGCPGYIRRIFFFLAALFFLPVSLSFSQEPDLKTLRAEIVQMAEKMNIHEQSDEMKILPRMEMAVAAEEQGNAALALELLESCRFDLNFMESQRAFESEQFWPRQAWLEIIFDLLRSYVLIAILALISVKLSFFRRKEAFAPVLAQWPTAGWLTAAGFLFGTYDLMRFGSAASSYFDLQIVFAVCAGLTGGVLPGLVCGIIFALLRVLLQPQNWMMAAVLAGAGLFGAFFFYAARRFGKILLWSACAGLCAGAAHAAVVFISPAWPREYALFAAGWTGLAEACGIILFTAVALALLRDEKQKAAEKELLQSKLLLLQTQIKPHFLFNALNTIAAVSSRESASQTRGLIEKLADFFRLSLQHGRDQITLSEEMNFVDAYIDLEKARFGDSLKIEKKFEWTERAQELKVPALLIQPLVENAIRHGVRKKTEKGTVCVDILESENDVEVSVRDDGTGMAPEKLAALQKGEAVRGEGLGIGLGNIRQRIRQTFGKKAEMLFESSVSGTRVTLKLPLKGK